MMDIGKTTKAWANSANAKENRLEVAKGTKHSATEKPFGDKDVGTVLNEIADPNWVDPAKVQREQKKDLDRDAFFKLMLAQMKNQDPYNTIESHEMAAQLAQFTSLEQMFNINNNLEAIKRGQAPASDYQALNFLGKEISADSSLITRTSDEDKHDLRFSLNGDATEVKVTVKDEAGDVVKVFNMNNLKKGKNEILWNGYSEQGFKQNVGEYRFTVEAKSGTGKTVAADTNTTGRITGVQYTAKGPLLMIGNTTVYLSDVKKILEPQETGAALQQVAQGLPGAPQMGPMMPAMGGKASMLPTAEEAIKPLKTIPLAPGASVQPQSQAPVAAGTVPAPTKVEAKKPKPQAGKMLAQNGTPFSMKMKGQASE
ncbi:MAG: flagellar hook capping FlgD N-terminal domain-containing protein [Bdellovibrionales bacterium]